MRCGAALDITNQRSVIGRGKQITDSSELRAGTEEGRLRGRPSYVGVRRLGLGFCG